MCIWLKSEGSLLRGREGLHLKPLSVLSEFLAALKKTLRNSACPLALNSPWSRIACIPMKRGFFTTNSKYRQRALSRLCIALYIERRVAVEGFKLAWVIRQKGVLNFTFGFWKKLAFNVTLFTWNVTTETPFTFHITYKFRRSSVALRLGRNANRYKGYAKEV